MRKIEEQNCKLEKFTKFEQFNFFFNLKTQKLK